jgi:hypothetical protein
VVAREGSEAGSVIAFVNAVAADVRDDYPDVRIDTLAYYYSLKPPASVRPRDNVVVRLAGLHFRDFSQSILHANNAEYREAVHGWAAITGHLRIWDYTVTVGVYGDLPLPNLRPLAVDLRHYRDLGIEGLFVQPGYLDADLRDLKLWVLLKLLEDPGRDLGDLIRDFTDGYYGRAGKHVRAYLRTLDRAAAARPSHIRFLSDPEEFDYLDLDFVRRAHAIFDRAARAVAGDGVRERRLRHARLTLDRATLLRWNALREAWSRRAGGDRPMPLDIAHVARRYRSTWEVQSALRLTPEQRERELTRVDLEIEMMLAEAVGIREF